jgi:hypothetical protein
MERSALKGDVLFMTILQFLQGWKNPDLNKQPSEFFGFLIRYLHRKENI